MRRATSKTDSPLNLLPFRRRTTRSSRLGGRAENWSVSCPLSCARMSGALPEPPGSWPTGLLTCTAPAVRRTLALARSASAVPGGAGVAKLEAVGQKPDVNPCVM